MAKLITDALKELYTAQGVTATGDTIADVLKDGNEKAYSATVSGNQIADVISQTAETGTFSGGGAAPTVVNEITWDGSTEGLESHTATIEGEEMTFYKVSDSVLPYGIMDGGDFYEYTTVAQDDDTTTGVKWGAFDGYVVVTGTFDVVSAYLNNSVCAVFGGVIVPSVGTWIKKDGGDYVKSVTVTAAE
jgi:hypothetical protein